MSTINVVFCIATLGALFFVSTLPSPVNSKTVCEKSIKKRVDGCSIPKTVSWKGIKHTLNKDWRKKNRKRFRSQCNKHDICYSTLGKSKKQCDNAFRKNMHKKCKHNPICLTEADIMYASVKNRGKKAYKNGQKWGKKHCKKK